MHLLCDQDPTSKTKCCKTNCCEKMAWQAEANATLGSPPLLPLPRRISDEDAELVVILIVISLECFCGTAPQGGADLLPPSACAIPS